MADAPRTGPETGSHPAAAGTATAGTGGGGGLASTDSLRERWPEVLDAVRRERKVAWLLLSNATVDSLADGALTLRFGREGEARGFSGSGYDRDLGQVLQTMFGIAPVIRAIAGAAPGPAGQAQAAPGRAAPGYAAAGRAGERGTGPRGPQPGGTGPGGTQPGTQPPGTQPPSTQAGRTQPVRSGPDQAAAGDTPAGRRPAREAASGGENPAAGNGAPSRASIAMSHSRSSRPEPGPDIADATDADALSGLDLIRRELGGRIIEEIGEP